MSWTEIAEVFGETTTGYGIETSTDGAAWTTLVADSGSTNTTYAHTGLPRGAFRYYHVRAIAGTAMTGFGRSDSARTTPNLPGKPVVTLTKEPYGRYVSNTVTGAIVGPAYRLTWPTPDDGAEATVGLRYEFAVANPETATAETVGHVVSTADGTVNFIIVRGPETEVRTIRVRAVNYAGDGPWSDAFTQVAVTVSATPALGGAGSDRTWTTSETVEVTITFSEAVDVDTSAGTPSITVELGSSGAKSATYQSGSGTKTLVFGYTLVTADGSHTSIGVTANSLALNGGTIRSALNNAHANLAHRSATHRGTRDDDTGPEIGNTADFTARFASLPAHHDGETFTFELHFSTEPTQLSYRTVQGGLLDVTGGAVRRAVRLTPGDNSGWEITLEPSQGGPIAIRLPARACTETNAVCADSRALARAASATVRPRPLSASFHSPPAEHDGTNPFEVRFHLSEEPAYVSYRTVRDALFTVTGGRMANASRLNPGKNRSWKLTVQPNGNGNVTLSMNPTTACDTPPGLCTTDGRMLGGGLRLLIAGPAALSVADAEVDEAEGATLDFVVTLGRRRVSATTVDYATSDGTATQPDDYTSTSGTLTFAAGETSKTVSVPVRNDAHDEGSETMTFTLSNASGAFIEDATATGTITNTDPMPKAWMVRFGRTVGSQVVDALGARLDGSSGSHLTVAGINLIGAPGTVPQAQRDDPFGLPDWARQSTHEPHAQTMTADEVLLRTAFHLSSGNDDAGAGPAFTAWGHVATGGFEAEEDGVTMDGDVTTGLVGFDAEWERVLAGVMLSQSKGDGAYRLDPTPGTDAGTVESSLTGVYPYASVDLNPRVSAWALAGAGSGELTLKREGLPDMATDLSLRMGAVGVRGQMLDGMGPSGVGLSVKSDAMWVATKTERTRDMLGTEGDVTRVRVALEGERIFEAGSGATFTPSAEVGLRHDGGDAETGTGVEVGAGVRYVAGPLTIEGRVRALVAHEASGYEEWGMSGAIRVIPSASGRGMTLSIAPEWGHTGSAIGRL